MSRSGPIVALLVALTFATAQVAWAQRVKGEDGTGGAAGVMAPPPMIDAPAAAAPSTTMEAPPLDDSAGEPQYEPDAGAPQPDEDKTNESGEAPDAGAGAYPPD